MKNIQYRLTDMSGYVVNDESILAQVIQNLFKIESDNKNNRDYKSFLKFLCLGNCIATVLDNKNYLLWIEQAGSNIYGGMVSE